MRSQSDAVPAALQGTCELGSMHALRALWANSAAHGMPQNAVHALTDNSMAWRVQANVSTVAMAQMHCQHMMDAQQVPAACLIASEYTKSPEDLHVTRGPILVEETCRDKSDFGTD